MAKKIGAIASLSIIGILIITTIILANVKINYSINCKQPTEIWVSYSNQSYQPTKSSEHANQIYSIINNSSKENTLSALFNGNLNKKAEIKTVSGNKSLPSNNGFYVEFSYSAPQTLMDDNKEFKDSNDNTVSYEKLVFTVTDVNESKDVNVYVFNKTTSQYYSHYYVVDANFYELYNFLIENEYNKYDYSSSSTQEVTAEDVAEVAIASYQMENLSIKI